VALIKSVIAADPSLKSAFQDVRGERSFEADKCLIESASGVIDISIPTQIVTLMFALEKVASDSEAIEEGAS
jgi:flagellar biosynthesis/type III secretory pathway protein FliH